MTSAADDVESDITTLRRQVETLRAKHDAAIAEKAALMAVMDAINQSVDDPTPVFSTILESAVQLCDASAGLLSTHDGVFNHMVSSLGLTDEYAATMRKPWRSSSGGYSEALLRGQGHHHILDLAADPAYLARSETARALAQLSGARTVLLVALRRHDRPLGLFTLYRTQVRGFTEQEIALLENFAAQAVIAMENARLITEQREALEQQTATAEVLQVINASPGDLAPVFDAMLEKAMRLCEASFGSLWTLDGERFRPVAITGYRRLMPNI